jgi:hypothetical protein
MVEYITIYVINFLNLKNTYTNLLFKIYIFKVDIWRFVLKLDNRTTLVCTKNFPIPMHNSQRTLVRLKAILNKGLRSKV